MIHLLHPAPSLATVAVALLFLPLIAGRIPPLLPTILLALSLALQQFAISAHNDWCDRDLDTLAKPSRPIPAGLITPRAVLRLAALFTLASLALAAPLGLDEVALVALFLLAGFAYNAHLKRTIFSWLPFALAFPLIPLFAAAALDTYPPWWPATALASQPLILAIHLTDSIPDIPSDTHSNAKGLAAHLGPTTSTHLRNFSLALSLVALPAAFMVRWLP